MAVVTGLGDAAVTIPAAVILFATFLLLSRRTAARWLVAVGLCGGLVAAAKLLTYIGASPAPEIVASPSGHVAASVLIYGAICSSGRLRPSLVACAGALIALIAVSRVYLGAHTGADVLAGLFIGACCLAYFMRARVTGHSRTLRTGAAASLALGLTGAALGWHLPIDTVLHLVADRLSG